MTVHGPDGRIWEVSKRPVAPGLLGRLRSDGWQVEARTEDEVRRWEPTSRREATAMVDEVALALRTGAPGPPGELPPDDGDADA